MSNTPPRRSRSLPIPTVRGWWLVAAAVAAGLLAFLVLWLGQRGERGLYRPDEQPPAAAAPVFQPLPAPPPAGSTAAADLPPPAASGARIEESTAPPAPAGEAGAAASTESRDATPIELSASSPVPIESPSPRYPRSALRRGESGEVLLRIEVDARGLPSRIEVASSSGSRDLDRAAEAAVRRWRFRPAMRDGVPVSGVVNVPITFSSQR